MAPLVKVNGNMIFFRFAGLFKDGDDRGDGKYSRFDVA